MTRTTTKQLSFEKLKQKGSSVVLLTRLMMACNDLTNANRALTDWKKSQNLPGASSSKGTGMYFVRVEIAHLHEGMKVIAKIGQDAALVSIINSCDTHTQESFSNLLSLLRGGENSAEYQQLIGRIRHNLTFHYDEAGKLIETAISDRASRQETRTSSITRGRIAHLWDFKVAHDVTDSIVTRQIWGISRSADVQIESDKRADRIHEFMCWFLDFSGEFIWKYFD